MDFISIREYFYKFYSALLLILLVPIVAFISLYLQPSRSQSDFERAPDTFVFFSATIIFLWTMMFILFNKKIKSLRNRQGLRSKLEKYFKLTIVRYIILSAAGMMLAVAFYFLRNDFFTICFVMHLVITILLWPTSPKVCRDLRLRGDEREMVYYKKDSL